MREAHGTGVQNGRFAKMYYGPPCMIDVFHVCAELPRPTPVAQMPPTWDDTSSPSKMPDW